MADSLHLLVVILNRQVQGIIMRANSATVLDREWDRELFESVTEEEIIYLWRSIKGRGLSEDEAWQAVVTGIALDMAFAKSRSCHGIEH
jgi:hypothetical protein